MCEKGRHPTFRRRSLPDKPSHKSYFPTPSFSKSKRQPYQSSAVRTQSASNNTRITAGNQTGKKTANDFGHRARAKFAKQQNARGRSSAACPNIPSYNPTLNNPAGVLMDFLSPIIQSEQFDTLRGAFRPNGTAAPKEVQKRQTDTGCQMKHPIGADLSRPFRKCPTRKSTAEGLSVENYPGTENLNLFLFPALRFL